MGKPPVLKRDGNDALRVRASFKGGRYYFSVTGRAESFFHGVLGYDEGDAVQWTVFRTLFVIGHVHLPNASSEGPETVSDLATPSSARAMTDRELNALSTYVRKHEYSSSEIEALNRLREETRLSETFSEAAIEELKSTKGEELQALARDLFDT